MRISRILFCLLLLVVAAGSRAQISMTLQVPPAGVLVKNQLWNMLLVNSGNSSVMARVSLVLLDEKTNQPVLTATSAMITLPKGARQLQSKDLGPIQYTYNGPYFRGDADPNGMLPVGSYQACYSVAGITKLTAPMAENCIQVNVDPLSPPLLNTPADEGALYTSYPQFTWLPPTPVGLFNDLSYTLIVVEVLPGQGKADAVEQNIPVYSAGLVKNLYMNYPSGYRSLDTGRLYAWRIVAMNNGQPAAMSDVWTFRVIKPGLIAPIVRETPWIELKRGLDVSVAAASKNLRLTYENVAADTTVAYTVTSIGDAGSPVVQQGELRLERGRNFLELPLEKTGRYSQRKVYLFSLRNARNESWTVKFTVTGGSGRR